MLFGCVSLLIAAGFVSEVPPLIAAKLTSTNEVSGQFIMTKTLPVSGANGRKESFQSKGVYRIRPNVDFEWKTLIPFETRFYATPTNYVYASEDETMKRQLSEMPGAGRFQALGKGDASIFFKVFDALYREEDGRFWVKAKPKVADLQRVIERVEAEGVSTNWLLRAVFNDRTELKIEFAE